MSTGTRRLARHTIASCHDRSPPAAHTRLRTDNFGCTPTPPMVPRFRVSVRTRGSIESRVHWNLKGLSTEENADRRKKSGSARGLGMELGNTTTTNAACVLTLCPLPLSILRPLSARAIYPRSSHRHKHGPSVGRDPPLLLTSRAPSSRVPAPRSRRHQPPFPPSGHRQWSLANGRTATRPHGIIAMAILPPSTR